MEPVEFFNPVSPENHLIQARISALPVPLTGSHRTVTFHDGPRMVVPAISRLIIEQLWSCPEGWKTEKRSFLVQAICSAETTEFVSTRRQFHPAHSQCVADTKVKSHKLQNQDQPDPE